MVHDADNLDILNRIDIYMGSEMFKKLVQKWAT